MPNFLGSNKMSAFQNPKNQPTKKTPNLEEMAINEQIEESRRAEQVSGMLNLDNTKERK